MIETLKEVRDALMEVDALIKHQYTGTSAGMTDLQYACDAVHASLPKIDALIAAQEKAEPVGEVRERSDSYGGTFVHWKKLPVAGMTLYATPQPAPSTSPLTDIDIASAIEVADAKWADADVPLEWVMHFARAIEAKIGAKP